MLTYAGPDITDFKQGPNIAVPQHDEIIDKQLDCLGDFIKLQVTISRSSLQEFSNKNDLKLGVCFLSFLFHHAAAPQY